MTASFLAHLLLAAPAAMSPLHADHAEATSFLKSTWNRYEENYHPNYVLDGDPKTAWVEGKDGDGVGESITIPVSTLKGARSVRLDIWNGYQKSRNLLEANGAPAKVTIIVVGPDGRTTGTTTATLTRTMGPQQITIPVKGGVEAVRIVVDSVTTGKKYKDTCISDVQIHVDSDVPYNAKAEGAKRGALQTWVKERKATAAYFAKLPREYPFASSRFEAGGVTLLAPLVFDDMMRLHPDPILAAEDFRVPRPEYLTVAAQLEQPFAKALPADDRALLVRLLSLDAAGDGAMPEPGTWMSPSLKGTEPLLPDNLWFLFRTWPTLRDVAFFEAPGRKAAPRPVFAEGYREDESVPGARYRVGTHTPSNAFVTRRPDGTIEAVFFANDTTTEQRGTETTTERRLLVYDAAQRLVAFALILRSTHTQQMGESPPAFDVIRLQWEGDKIGTVDVVTTRGDYWSPGDPEGLVRRHFRAAPVVASAGAP